MNGTKYNLLWLLSNEFTRVFRRSISFFFLFITDQDTGYQQKYIHLFLKERRFFFYL